MNKASTENMPAKLKPIKVSFEPIFPLQPLPQSATFSQKFSRFLRKFKGVIQRV